MTWINKNVRALFPAPKSPLHNGYSNSQNTGSMPLINRRKYNRARTNEIPAFSEITCYLSTGAAVDKKASEQRRIAQEAVSADVKVWKLGWGLLVNYAIGRAVSGHTHTHTLTGSFPRAGSENVTSECSGHFWPRFLFLTAGWWCLKSRPFESSHSRLLGREPPRCISNIQTFQSPLVPDLQLPEWVLKAGCLASMWALMFV